VTDLCSIKWKSQISITYSTEQTVLTHIREVLGSSIDRDTDYTGFLRPAIKFRCNTSFTPRTLPTYHPFDAMLAVPRRIGQSSGACLRVTWSKKYIMNCGSIRHRHPPLVVSSNKEEVVSIKFLATSYDVVCSRDTRVRIEIVSSRLWTGWDIC
jgi:hypothetical protein